MPNNGQRTDIAERLDDIKRWIDEDQSHAYMARELQCKVDTLKRWLKKLGIDYAGNQGCRGQIGVSTYREAAFYLKENGPHIKSAKLKYKLVREGIKEARCEECGIDHWRGNEAPLELHHIDENPGNNKLSNLTILCANCHAVAHGCRSAPVVV